MTPITPTTPSIAVQISGCRRYLPLSSSRLNRILALSLDLVGECGATFAVALLNQLEDRRSVGGLVHNVGQKITAA